MTRVEFRNAAKLVSLYGNLSIVLTAVPMLALGSLACIWAEPSIRALGSEIRSRVQDETLTGLIGGLIVSALIVPFLLLLVLPALLVDKLFGVKCPHCRRSVTLRCAHAAVIESGRCSHCKQVLFDPHGT